jgi:hypothetical protein
MKKIIIYNSKPRTERGIALVIVLVLSAVGLGLMTTLIYLITTGTQVSGINKRYKTALEASMGGKDIVLDILSMKDRSMTEIDLYLDSLSGLDVTYRTPTTCTGGGFDPGLQTKLRASSSSWLGCDSTIAIDTSTATPNYDIKFELGVNPRYTVYAKIVDTIAGSEVGESTKLKSSGVVASQGDVIQVAGVPNMYTVEIQTENNSNPAEKAKLQVLYQY